MRALAARMRGFAAKTSLRLFRRQFERAASELEEAAVDLESRSGVSFEDHTGKSTRWSKTGLGAGSPAPRS